MFFPQVSRKPEVPYFGPLFNEMIVDQKVLPGLVRATAINASRAKRSMLTYYQNYYEERFKSLENIIKNHKDATTFEDFVTSVYSPAPLTNLFQYTASSASSSRPASLIASASLGAGSNLGGTNVPAPFMETVCGSEMLLAAQTASFSGSNNNNHIDEATEHSPKVQHRKLAFRNSNSGLGSSAAKRPLSIKEEAGLPGETSPPSVPTRKR